MRPTEDGLMPVYTPEQLERLEGAMLTAYFDECQTNVRDTDRLRAVYGSEFTDAEFRVKAQQIAELAASIFDVPTVQVNLVGDDELEVVAGVGNNKPVYPIEDSYCQYTVGSRRPFLVRDGLNHALVCAMRETLSGFVRSYLGVPLIYDGQVVGTLCVVDSKPRVWTDVDVTLLSQLGQVLTRYRGGQ